ncbi:MAG: LamG-like jellyroll fold domain-containing protein, partial [Pseudomonadota bacterium]
DLLMGGDGDDVLISRSDAGEQRLGQLVLDDPSRDFPDSSIDGDYLKLVDWVDQEFVADDVLIGGEGADTFQFETLLNAKVEHLVENNMGDGRTIHYHGVAGENARLHDHWVDGIGIDVIGDYNADEDTISVIGHTTEIEVTYQTIDTDGDGIDDDAVSVIRLYSQQGNNGGAHDEDALGYIIVHGDRVEEDDVITDAGAHYGIVDTIDDLQEAVAPNGETRINEFDGVEVTGVDTRDVDGDPIGSDPLAYSENPWLKAGAVDLASGVPAGLEAPGVVLLEAGGTFGVGAVEEIAHTPDMELDEGTIAFAFTADAPGNGQEQALFSKDHSGFQEGGHLTVYITSGGRLKLRYQDEDSSQYLEYDDEKIQAGEEYHVAFSFDDDEIMLYVNGALVDVGEGHDGGMTGNTYDIALGASTMTRNGEDDNFAKPFTGDISNLVILDRPIEPVEAIFLADTGGSIDGLIGLHEELAEMADEIEEEDDPVQEEEAAEEEAPVEEEEEAPEEEENPVQEDEPIEDEAPAPEETPVQEEEPVEEDEEEESSGGIGAIIAGIMELFMSLFSFLGGNKDDDDETNPDVEAALDEIETVLTDLIPTTGEMDETIPDGGDDEEDDEGDMMAA